MRSLLVKLGIPVFGVDSSQECKHTYILLRLRKEPFLLLYKYKNRYNDGQKIYKLGQS